MGFRVRKSINLGGGFRINLSKSGIGYSWGTKGYRVLFQLEIFEDIKSSEELGERLFFELWDSLNGNYGHVSGELSSFPRGAFSRNVASNCQ